MQFSTKPADNFDHILLSGLPEMETNIKYTTKNVGLLQILANLALFWNYIMPFVIMSSFLRIVAPLNITLTTDQAKHLIALTAQKLSVVHEGQKILVLSLKLALSNFTKDSTPVTDTRTVQARCV